MVGPLWEHEEVLPELPTPFYENYARMPRMLNMPDGGVLLSWVEPHLHGHVLKFAVYKEGVWKRQGVVTQGESWFVNWADFHSVVAIDDTFWVAHWLVKRPGGKTFDYDIELAITHDAGETWQAIGRPYQDSTAAEHGFVTIFPVAGNAGIIWLDGRNVEKKRLNLDGSEEFGLFELRYADILRDGTILSEQVLDANTCTCCWTAAAPTSNGVVAVWRGRTNDEIRDHRTATLSNGKWSKPALLGNEQWQIAGCPVNGPALAVSDHQVVAVWFTVQADVPRIRMAFSEDSGRNFSDPIDIDNKNPLGRVSVIWQNTSTAYVAWMSAPHENGKKSWLMLQQVDSKRGFGKPIKLVALNAGRDTGVPQMVSTKTGLLLSWTHGAPDYGIYVHEIPWEKLESKSNFLKLKTMILNFFGS